MKDLLSKNITGSKKVGLFQQNDQPDGPLTETLLEELKAGGYDLAEMDDFMKVVHKTKIDCEVKNVKVAA